MYSPYSGGPPNMYSRIICLALIGYSSGQLTDVKVEDDGQWRPESDGSAMGNGDAQWGTDDGSWKPHLDGSVLGNGDQSWESRKRRSADIVNQNALPVPLDDPITAYAKNAQLIQQQTEGIRNILGGGVPVALPADTFEVAAAKRAHAIAHAAQISATNGLPYSVLKPSVISHPHVYASPVVNSFVPYWNLPATTHINTYGVPHTYW